MTALEVRGVWCGYGRGAVARALAYVPQKQAVPFVYRVEEFVLMGRAPHLKLLQQPGPEDRARARAALVKMGIAHAGIGVIMTTHDPSQALPSTRTWCCCAALVERG